MSATLVAPIDNKTTQKVKESISRMVKSDQRCASVILDPEVCEPTELLNTTVARMLPQAVEFKSGKTEYMCDGGRVVLLVNYWEPSFAEQEQEQQDAAPNLGQQYIIIGVLVSAAVHSELSEHPVQTILDVVSPPEALNGTTTIEFPVGEQLNQAYKQAIQLGVRVVPVDAAFKISDQVVQRFYEYMRRLGLIIDEPEEDMGALAASCGIEW